MGKWFKVLALASICFVAIGTGTWGISLLMSPINFFSTIGIIACSAAVVLLVFGGTNKAGIKWKAWRVVVAAKKAAKKANKDAKRLAKTMAKEAKRAAKEAKRNSK